MIETVLDGDGSTTPLWIDVSAPTPDELDELARRWSIPAASLDECTAPLHLPKYERLGQTAFVITRIFDEDSGPDAHSFLPLTRKLALFLGDRFLLTIHRRPLSFLDDVKTRTRRAKEPLYLQVAMLEILLAGVETYHAALEETELRLHEFEEQLIDEKAGGVSAAEWREVFRTKIRIEAFRRLLWHIQNATQKFVPRSAVNQPLADDLRERCASLLFLAESLDSDLDNLLGVQLSLAANRANDVMRLLTLFSAVFLPITFIVGVYGMNFRVMPELELRYGYAGVWVLMLVTVIAVLIWFRRRGFAR